MDLISALDLFVRISERGGMAAAGRDLGLSPAMVTERLSALEAHYGTRLINRTTRALSLTDEGRVLLESARQLINDTKAIEARIKLGATQLSGLIRISAPLDLGRNIVSKTLNSFIATHPEICIELILSDGYVDLAAQGIDLALRFGDLKDSSLNAVRLGVNRRIVCASPAYIRAQGAPATPQDLHTHNCLLMRFGAGVDREWIFNDKGKRLAINVTGNRIANDGSLVRQWCIEGHGIALKSYWDVIDDLAQGRLVEILSDYAGSQNTIQVVYQGGRAIPKRVRAVIDALTAAFAAIENARATT